VSARTSPRRIVIASRESALALAQARRVQARLAALYPGASVELLGLTTEGDRRLEVSLARIGGKGLFVKELEHALAAGRADLAVHSAKDLPAELAPGFVLAAVSEREDPRDAFVSNRYPSLGALPPGARVGTSSLRRQCQLRARHPGLAVEPLRGNVTTRLGKLDEGRYEALVLAAAGLVRLGLGARITALLDPETSVPAPGQGALALECRAERGDVIAWLAPLNDEAAARCVAAERRLAHRRRGARGGRRRARGARRRARRAAAPRGCGRDPRRARGAGGRRTRVSAAAPLRGCATWKTDRSAARTSWSRARRIRRASSPRRSARPAAIRSSFP
jgi:hydroxymethylbilane synthase